MLPYIDRSSLQVKNFSSYESDCIVLIDLGKRKKGGARSCNVVKTLITDRTHIQDRLSPLSNVLSFHFKNKRLKLATSMMVKDIRMFFFKLELCPK